MSNNQRWTTGGANIIPSARPSIHAHTNCPFSNIGNMSYGWREEVEEVELQGNATAIDRGVDEADCVMSNYRHRASPMRSPNSGRKRHSFSHSQTTDDDSENQIIAKSLPADLSTSDVFLRKSLEDILKTIGPGPNTPERSCSTLNGSYSSDTSRRSESEQCVKQGNKSSYFLKIVIVLASIIVGYVYNNLSQKMEYYDQNKFYKDLRSLGIEHKINNDNIIQVQSGVSTIFQKEDTSSFIFLYDSENTDFDHKKFNYFMDDLANKAAKFLRNDSTPLQFTTVVSSSLDMYDHRELINKYRDDIKKTGVMLVKEIDEVPSELAMAFHFYCDEFNPLVKKSAIFFTLDINKCSNKAAKLSPLHAYVEKCLKSKWLQVPTEQIGPLLTRVVNIVVNLTTRQ